MNQKKKTDPSLVVLKVKRRIVRVKKYVLVEESKYFQALLSGNYSDSNTKEINLTNTVEDMEVLKSVVQFMENGKIRLNDQNIQQVSHLSTYFAIDKLQVLCTEYIKDNLVCEDWLNYYFMASENALSEVLNYTEAFIASRMHDLLIYEAETLELHPDQLDHFRQNGYLKFCSFDSLTLFVAKWLCKSDHADDRKLTVALNVLENAKKDTVQSKEDKGFEKDLTESVDKLKIFLKVKGEENKIANEVLKIIEEVVHEYTVDKNDNMPDKHENNAKPEKVTAIITASERKSLKRKSKNDAASEKFNINSIFDGISDMSDEDEDDIVFAANENLNATRMIDLCVYDTKSNTWYHLSKFNEREYMGHYSHYFCDWTKNIKDDVVFSITACDTHVIFLDQNAISKALILDVRNNSWRRIDCLEELTKEVQDEGEHIRTMNIVVGRNNVIYLVLCIQIKDENVDRLLSDDNDVGTVHFRVYHFDIDSLEVIQICETDNHHKVPKCKDWVKLLRETNCHISEIRKEMIITHYEGSGLNVVYVMNLEAEEDEFGKPKKVGDWFKYTDPAPKEVLEKETDKDHLLFKWVEILETEDAYLILAKEDETLSVKFQYLFETEEFKEVKPIATHNLCKDDERFMDSDSVRFIKAKRVWDSKRSLCQGSSLWQIEQYLQFGNVFQEVKFEIKGNPEVIKHRPLPATSLISVCSAIVDDTFFKGLKPVKHFLHTAE